MKKRIFVAIKINRELSNTIAKLTDKRLNKSFIRRIKPENLHITLVPPWYENNRDIEKIIRKLKNISFNIEPFTIVFNKVSTGPDSRKPRLIWATGKAPRNIIKLRKFIEKALSKKPEKRPYKLHLTIARINKDYSGRIENIKLKVDWKFSVHEFALMESKLKRTGAEYEILREKDISY